MGKALSVSISQQTDLLARCDGIVRLGALFSVAWLPDRSEM